MEEGGWREGRKEGRGMEVEAEVISYFCLLKGLRCVDEAINLLSLLSLLPPFLPPSQHFLHAMDEKFKDHAHYTSRQVNPQDKELDRDEQFRVRHYAGDVT